MGKARRDALRDIVPRTEVTPLTNFIGALAQTEAAAEIFRAQNSGHLVMISSVSAMRGLPKNTTTYAATKAGVAHLAEGFRADVMRTPIKVTVLYPGYIVSEMSATSEATPLVASTEKGVRAMVEAIEKEKASNPASSTASARARKSA